MKKVIFFVSLLLTGTLNATVYEDAEDGLTTDWSVYDKTPEGATISNIDDPDGEKGRVISLNGSGIDNGYKFNLHKASIKTLCWDLKYNEHFTIYVSITTENNGGKLLVYNDVPPTESYSPIGLGVDKSDNQWHTICRDFEKDARIRYDDNNLSVVSVNSFRIRGSGLVDNIKDPEDVPDFVMIEDAEDNTTIGWSVYDNSPEGATITNVDDGTGNRVIKLDGDGLYNGYMLGHWGSNGFNLAKSSLSWKMKYNEPFSVYVVVKTEDGNRYLWYSSTDIDKGLILGGRYIHYGIGANVVNGEWHTFTRNLEADLQNHLSDLHVLGIKAFLVRGSGLVDEIKAF